MIPLGPAVRSASRVAASTSACMPSVCSVMVTRSPRRQSDCPNVRSDFLGHDCRDGMRRLLFNHLDIVCPAARAGRLAGRSVGRSGEVTEITNNGSSIPRPDLGGSTRPGWPDAPGGLGYRGRLGDLHARQGFQDREVPRLLPEEVNADFFHGAIEDHSNHPDGFDRSRSSTPTTSWLIRSKSSISNNQPRASL